MACTLARAYTRTRSGAIVGHTLRLHQDGALIIHDRYGKEVCARVLLCVRAPVSCTRACTPVFFSVRVMRVHAHKNTRTHQITACVRQSSVHIRVRREARFALRRVNERLYENGVVGGAVRGKCLSECTSTLADTPYACRCGRGVFTTRFNRCTASGEQDSRRLPLVILLPIKPTQISDRNKEKCPPCLLHLCPTRRAAYPALPPLGCRV